MKKLIAFGVVVVLMSLVQIFEPKNNPEKITETTFQLVPYSTAPTMEGAIWLESDNIPPPSIFHFDFDGNKDIEYIPKPQTKEPKTYTIEELEEIYKEDPWLGKLVKRLWGFEEPEPNEPKYYNFQATISRDIPPDTALVLWVSPGSKFHQAIEEQPEPIKYSLPIPTWPDYIELDKDLEIEMPYKMWYGRMAFENFIFPKGTKIYFKEDE